MRTLKPWPLYLVFPFRYGRTATAAVIFCILLPIFQQAQALAPDTDIPAIFFSAILAYIIPIFSLITEKCREAMQELRPILNLPQAEFDALLHGLKRGAGEAYPVADDLRPQRRSSPFCSATKT